MYNITITCNQQGVKKWGFEVSPQNPGGAYLGTIIITNFSTKAVGFNKYVTHTQNGTNGMNSKSWNFNWIAPSAGAGSVTFYG